MTDSIKLLDVLEANIERNCGTLGRRCQEKQKNRSLQRYS